MTKAEFIFRQRAAKREENLVSGIWMAGFFGVLFLNLRVAKWMDHHKPAASVQILYACLLLGFVLANIPFLLWLMKRRTRKYGLRCPGCDKPLIQTVGLVAVATGHCGHCGAAVFDQK